MSSSTKSSAVVPTTTRGSRSPPLTPRKRGSSDGLSKNALRRQRKRAGEAVLQDCSAGRNAWPDSKSCASKSQFSGYQYDLTGNAADCVSRYLELSGKKISDLKQAATPCFDDSQLPPEDMLTKGELSADASKIAKVLMDCATHSSRHPLDSKLPCQEHHEMGRSLRQKAISPDLLYPPHEGLRSYLLRW